MLYGAGRGRRQTPARAVGLREPDELSLQRTTKRGEGHSTDHQVVRWAATATATDLWYVLELSG